MNGRYHPLPTPLTTLLGREQEIATLRQLFQRPNLRLVTITGPFGVGKTSLSLAAAQALPDLFADGICFVPLAPINDLTLIIPTIAQTLNVPESPRQLRLDTLKEYLQDKQILLILDNFEQIINAAPLLTELLTASAGLRLLVTSREPLRLRGEQEFLLSPLALPQQPDLAQLRHAPSIELFVQRAQAAQLDFQLTEQNAAAVVGICQQLDGLPLAIELAAARIKLFPPQALLEQLQTSSLQLLRSGARDLPDRHQTVRRAVRWSYELLTDEERQALRRLAIFVGGCTLEAALAVLGAPASFETLDSLVNKSLIRQTGSGGTPRFTMLEMIREFGREQLQSTAELATTRHTHAHWYTALAESAEPHLLGANQKTWLPRLEVEQDNFRAVFRWALEARDGDVAYRLAGALGQFWFVNGRWTEGRRLLEEVLALPTDVPPDPTRRAKVLYQASYLAQYQGDYARARGLCEQSLALYRTLDNQFWMVMTIVRLARITLYQEDQEARRAFLAEAATLIGTLPDSIEKARAYKDMFLSIIYSLDPLTEANIRYQAEHERLSRQFKDRTELALAVLQRATLSLIQGDVASAISLANEVQQSLKESSTEYSSTRTDTSNIYLDIIQAEFDVARQRLDKIIESTYRRKDHVLELSLVNLAFILWKQNLAIWSARVLGLANIRADGGHSNPNLALLERFTISRNFYDNLRTQLGAEAFARELAVGRQMSIADLQAIPNPSTSPTHSIDSLTPRELDVLQLLAQELSNPQIAEQLVVSRRTVDAHLRSIYDKLGVKSRDAALRVAQERSLLP